MEQRQKVLFNIINKFLLVNNCEQMTVELGDTYDLWDGNNFSCHASGTQTSLRFPIPMSRYISEYVENVVKENDHYYSETGEDFYNFELIVRPKERVVEVVGVYSIYNTEDFTETVIEAEEEPEVFDEIFDYLEESGADILEVNVASGGDSGWIEDTAYDVNGKQIDVTQEMKDVGYRLLSDFPGWEMNEGSTSSFTWDPHRRILIFKFAYNTEEQATELISKEFF